MSCGCNNNLTKKPNCNNIEEKPICGQQPPHYYKKDFEETHLADILSREHKYCDTANVLAQLRNVNWGEIFGDINKQDDLICLLNKFAHSIRWEDLKGNIYANEALMCLINQTKNSIEWGTIIGDVEDQEDLIEKIKEMLGDPEIIADGIIKVLKELFKLFLEDSCNLSEQEFFDLLEQVIAKFFDKEPSSLFNAILNAFVKMLQNYLDYGDDAIVKFLENLVKAILKLLKGQISELNYDLINEFLEMILDYLILVIQEGPEGNFAQNIYNKLILLLKSFRLTDLSDVDDSINLDPEKQYLLVYKDGKWTPTEIPSNYDEHFEFSIIFVNKVLTLKPIKWTGTKAEYNALDDSIKTLETVEYDVLD